jgi:hypothetical protein
MILTPVFTPPLDTAVGGERPTFQLVGIEKKKGEYFFDFTNFRKYVEICLKNGVEAFEISHFFTQWGATSAPKIVATVNGKETDVLRVTYGFVAVECEAGENEIVFEYSTPGFLVSSTVTVMEKDIKLPGGVWISLVAFALFLLYMAYFKLIRKHKAETKFFDFDFYDDCGADFDDPKPKPAFSAATVSEVEPDVSPEEAESSEEISEDEVSVE